jgi:N-acetyl-gamma-glutamyl-phosphate reductase
MHLSVFANIEHRHVLLSAAFDNLRQGASGAAVQNLNLLLTRQ